jgi:hypothetical protein
MRDLCLVHSHTKPLLGETGYIPPSEHGNAQRPGWPANRMHPSWPHAFGLRAVYTYTSSVDPSQTESRRLDTARTTTSSAPTAVEAETEVAVRRGGGCGPFFVGRAVIVLVAETEKEGMEVEEMRAAEGGGAIHAEEARHDSRSLSTCCSSLPNEEVSSWLCSASERQSAASSSSILSRRSILPPKILRRSPGSDCSPPVLGFSTVLSPSSLTSLA